MRKGSTERPTELIQSKKCLSFAITFCSDLLTQSNLPAPRIAAYSIVCVSCRMNSNDEERGKWRRELDSAHPSCSNNPCSGGAVQPPIFWQHMLAGGAAGIVEHCVMVSIFAACTVSRLPLLLFASAPTATLLTDHVSHTRAQFPVDTLKTRLQALREAPCAEPRSQLQRPLHVTLRRLVQREGIGALWRGMPAMAAAAGPAHGVYFAAYEAIKRRLERAMPVTCEENALAAAAVYSAAGGFATVAADAISTPMDTVKQRQQLTGGCMRKTIMGMLRCEGLGAFYASYRTTLLMNVPFTALYFTTYELAKQALSRAASASALVEPRYIASESMASAGDISARDVLAGSNAGYCIVDTPAAALLGTPNEPPAGSHAGEEVLVHLASGGAAGALASSVTTPLDVVKTRLQTQTIGLAATGRAGEASGIAAYAQDVLPTMRRIAREEGSSALLRGLGPRVLYHTPSAAICWATYEAMNSWFGTELSEL